MKIILTGSTGFTGSEVLTQCLNNSAITSIVALSRRQLPDSIPTDPKLKTVILKDFTTYSDEVLEACQGAEGCLWCLGAVRSQSPSGESRRRINLDYTLAAATAFQSALMTPRSVDDGRKGKNLRFRFVYCSGMLTEPDQDKSLWFMGDFRRMRGEVENKLVALAKEHQDKDKDTVFESIIVRPGAVLARGNRMPDALVGLTRSVRVEELAAAMVEIALAGSEVQIVQNWRLREVGRAVLLRSERDEAGEK